MWIITCNKNNGAVGTLSGEPMMFNTKQEAHNWILTNKESFPDCKFCPEELIQNNQGIINPISMVIESNEPPNISGYQLYIFDVTNF